jgi:predicted exporter
MLFIILSISIDYGIYMGSSNINQNSYEAILYSLLSTFAGFGVLIFSKVNALFSIGITATIGIFAIAILLIILKRSK